MEAAEKEFVRSRRYEHELAVLVIDIDHFKSINDSRGHHVGDLCLKEFVRVCNAELRGNDEIGRVGGEEFIALLVESGRDDAVHTAERLRQVVAETPLGEEGDRFYVTVSIGVAYLSVSDGSLEQLIQRADKALYQAKESGRNRVVCA